MKFEKHFPSIGSVTAREIESISPHDRKFVDIDSVVENCLDKQQVKEAIEKLINPNPDSEGRLGRNIGLRQLQEELGL